ncbi:MAG: helix-turn-helix domain-containing protein [Stenotrophomonas sp.]|nr:helix-turn-helix domain-containing protein [Stenotrophomonas sp.]
MRKRIQKQYANDLCPPEGAPDNAQMNNVAANLRELMARRGVSENRLATETGVPQPTIHRALNGTAKDPRDGTLRPLAAFFGVTVEQIRTKLPTPDRPNGGALERVPAYQIRAFDGPDDLDGDREVLVAEVDVVVSGGPGAAVPEFVETSYRMAYQLNWFKQVGAKPDNVRVMKVTGDSMERTLFHGDRIAVNLADNQITDGRVYVFMTGGVYPDVKVKRLYRTSDGRVRVVSDNLDKTQYPDEYLDAHDLEHVQVLGRVIDRSGRGGL